MTPWHRPACGYTSSWRVKPLDAHQPVTPETLTKAAQDAHQPATAETPTSAWPDRQSVLQRGQEKEAALEAGYGMTDYV